MHFIASPEVPTLRLRRWAKAISICGAVVTAGAVPLSPNGVDLPGVAHAAASDAPVVTFTGLRVYKDGSATLFVELTRTTRVEVKQEGAKVSFLLAGAKVRFRNNKNPLLADYFGTNVVRAGLVDDAKGVWPIVQLRENVSLDHDMASSQTGARLRVDVPPPSGS